MKCCLTRGQGSLEYLLLIGGVVLVSVVVWVLVSTGPIQEGKNILEMNLAGGPWYPAGGTIKAIQDENPSILLFSGTPSDLDACGAMISYESTDDLTSPVDLLVRLAASTDETTILSLTSEDFDKTYSPTNPPEENPPAGVFFVSFSGSPYYFLPDNGICGTYYFTLRICDTSFQCVLWHEVEGNTPLEITI